jgi:hypothetical protein
MRSKHRRSSRYGTIAALTLVGVAMSVTSAAAAVVDPAPIGPHQYFTGQVNGASVNAVIQVGCFGPVVPGETGHPIAGQSVDVLPIAASTTTGVGYTGESADRVLVGFGNSATTAVVSLSEYAVKAAIPTTLNLPCSGTGTVTFVPAPTSSTARTATVKVTYQNIGV